jgi:hypothetical protein
MLRSVTALIFALCLASLAHGQMTPEKVRASVQQVGGVENFVRAVATNTSKMAGQMIDDQTKLTAVAANGKTLVYYSQLVNFERLAIQDIQDLRRRVASKNVRAVCTSPTTTVLINEFSVDFKYMVYSKSNEYLFEYTFNKATCALDYRW